jgi:hypothetical protein
MLREMARLLIAKGEKLEFAKAQPGQFQSPVPSLRDDEGQQFMPPKRKPLKRNTQRNAQWTGCQERMHGMMYSNPVRAAFQWLAPNSFGIQPRTLFRVSTTLFVVEFR